MGLFLNLLVLLSSAAAILTFKLPASADFEKNNFVAPPKSIRLFTFGYSETVSDSLWLRVVQNLTTCERVPGGDPHAPKVKDLIPKGQSACKKGWVYQMLDLITDLTPNFRIPYVLGATTLSVLVDDREGAALLFEKGVQQFPKDWDIAYRAGYHFSIEMNEPKRAAELLVQAADNGAPPWVYALAGRLYTKAGQALLAKSVLEDQIAKMDPDDKLRKHLQERLIEAERVLESSKSDKDQPAN